MPPDSPDEFLVDEYSSPATRAAAKVVGRMRLPDVHVRHEARDEFFSCFGRELASELQPINDDEEALGAKLGKILAALADVHGAQVSEWFNPDSWN